MPVIKAFTMQMLQELGNNIWDVITESANQKTQVPTPLTPLYKNVKNILNNVLEKYVLNLLYENMLFVVEILLGAKED